MTLEDECPLADARGLEMGPGMTKGVSGLRDENRKEIEIYNSLLLRLLRVWSIRVGLRII